MKTLFVKQTHNTGLSRTWRLRPVPGVTTLGTSRLANLASVDPKTGGIAGAFEYRNNAWYWLPMGAELEAAPISLEGQKELQIGDSRVSFEFTARDPEFMQKVLQSQPGGDSASEYELEVVSWYGRLMSTRILRKGGKHQPVSGDGLQVHRRKVRLDSDKHLRKFKGDPKDRSARHGALIVSGFGVLFTLAAIFGPKQQHQVVAALPPLPPRMTVSIAALKKTETKKVEKTQAPSANAAAPAGGGGRVSGALSALKSGRISKLLGKVSAHAARSREVIVTQGVKAGEGSSGRALSALGRVDSGRGDWAATGATGSGVGTVGSGRGLAGVAGLAAGRTGSGGVGLVEDESEISGGLDREVIAGIIRSQLGQILYCYERQLSAYPDLFGKVAVRFTIGANGAVESQKIGDTTLKNASVESCILSRVANWKFPTPRGGTKVQVTYPFLFKSTN